MVSLYHQSWFDNMYTMHLDKLIAKTHVQRARLSAKVVRQLSEHPLPTAILVTDSALIKDEHAELYEVVLKYVREGGTAIFMEHFPGFIPVTALKGFFGRAGLPWAAGSHLRTNFSVNHEAVGADLAAKLPASYSQKALFVKNVKPEEAWYRTDENSRLESLVFPPDPLHRPDEAPVVVGHVGNGRIGYIGDVNGEEKSADVILAMCGLL